MQLTYRVKQALLAFGDAMSFLIGFWLALFFRTLTIPSPGLITLHLSSFLILFAVWIVLNYINGLYDIGKYGSTVMYRRLIETGLIAFIVSIIFFYVSPGYRITPKTILMLNIAFGYGISAIWRFSYSNLISARRLQTRVILVGYTAEIKDLIDLLFREQEKGYRIVALIDPMKQVKPADLPGVEVYHDLQTIRPAITNFKADIVVIAPHLQHDQATLRELYELLFWNVQMNDLASFYEMVTGRIPPSTFSEAWFLEHLRNIRQPIYDRVRTALDLIAGIAILAVFCALLPFIALGIKLSSPGPIFIRQKRIGLSGKEFTLYKFRSMYALSEDGSAELGGVQFAKKGDKRITWIGKILRQTRLDELPQVINLMKRDVTLIGPRPERPEIIHELESRMPYYPLRHLVRPGLTGWALINQNYTDNYDTSLQKLQYDLYYIKNRSFLLDTVIFLRTINVILRWMGQ